MDLRRVLARRTVVSTGLVLVLLAVVLAGWTIHDTRREIDATRKLVRSTVEMVIRSREPGAADASAPETRHVRIYRAGELTPQTTAVDGIVDRWIGADVEVLPLSLSDVRTTGGSTGDAPRYLVITPDWRSELVEHLHSAAAAFAALLALAVVVSITQYRTLLKAFAPVQTLREQLEHFAAGRLSTRLSVPELDELAVIARSFNGLAERLENTVGEHKRLSSLLLSMRTEERQRLAREVHDDLGQNLTAISVNLASLKRVGPDAGARQEAIARLDRDIQALRESTRRLLVELRQTDATRLSGDVDPAALIGEWQGRFPQVQWDLSPGLAQRLDALPPAEYEVATRVLRESLTNVFRHAHPRSISVRFVDADPRPGIREARLEIENDGIDALPLADSDGLPGGVRSITLPGFGIQGMRERATAAGAELSVGRVDAEADGSRPARWRVSLRLAPEAHA